MPQGCDRIDCALECINAEYDVMQSQDDLTPCHNAEHKRAFMHFKRWKLLRHDMCLAPKGKQVDDAAVNALCGRCRLWFSTIR